MPAAVGVKNPDRVKWRESLHSQENMQVETSLWDNLLRRYLCPVSRLCRPASVGLAFNSPVPQHWEPGPDRCPYPRMDCGWMDIVRTLRGKKMFAFGSDEPSFSKPTKGLKEGVFPMSRWSKECAGEEENKGMWSNNYCYLFYYYCYHYFFLNFNVWSPRFCVMVCKRFARWETLSRMAGRVDCNQTWWSLLRRVDGGSPRIREVCWWVVRVVQSGWQVS